MSQTQENNDGRMPTAIYFDTSAMRDAGYALRKAWMENIRAVAQHFGIDLWIPELVLEEWLWYLQQECQKALDECKSKALFVNELVGLTIEIPAVPSRSLLKPLIERHAQRLNEAGFLFVPTAKLELTELLHQSVRHISPFEDRDRGFRDAVILESIAAHAQENYDHPDILVISLDKGFQRGIRRLSERGLKGEIADPGNGGKLLENRRIVAVQRFLAEGDPVLNAFLEGQKEAIFKKLLNFSVNLATIKGHNYGTPPIDDPLYNATIRRVNAIRPLSLKRAFAGTQPIFFEIKPGREPINFQVEIEADLTIERNPFPITAFLGPEVSLNRPVDIEPSWRSWVHEDPVVEDITVRRDINIEASVIQNLGDEPKYRDLEIHGIW